MPLEEMAELVQSVNRSEVSEEDFCQIRYSIILLMHTVLENAGQYVRNAEKDPEKYGKKHAAQEKAVPMPAPVL